MDYNNFFVGNCTPAAVIATFNVNGEIRPDFVRIIQPDQSQETFKIYDAKLQKQVHAYMQYSCNIVVNDLLKEIKLTYFVDKHVWCIGK